jgi:hypothetical protein
VLGKDVNTGQHEGIEKIGVSATVCAEFYCNDFLPQTYEYNFQSQNISTVLNTPNNRNAYSPKISDILSNHSSEFLDL